MTIKEKLEKILICSFLAIMFALVVAASAVAIANAVVYYTSDK